MKYLYTLVVLSFLLCACGETDSPKSDGIVITQAQPVRDLKLYRFDSLEHIFSNDNWLIVDGTDSCYIYFSRLGKGDFRTFYYKIFKGDSSNVSHSNFIMSSDTITWLSPIAGKRLHLEKTTNKEAIWCDSTCASYFRFKRISDKEIILTLPSDKKLVLKKTLALSLFLIRSRYDFDHGTHYAFIDTNFSKHSVKR